MNDDRQPRSDEPSLTKNDRPESAEAPPDFTPGSGGRPQPAFESFPGSQLQSMEPQQAFDTLVRFAVDRRASDIFLLSDEKAVTLAMRWLGTVHRLAYVSREQGVHLINYVKAISNMDIAERRRPGNGRCIHELDDRTVDLRVNSIATLNGEDVTLRLLDREIGLRRLDDLGLTERQHGDLVAALSSPSGLILVTGPTGSGKTTTLYACLQHLNDGARKINTLEDPIEYHVDGLRQSQVHPKLGLDFPELLANVLRQAPDTIMIGEVRDRETAITAVRAANSGHLVLATLHAPVAAGAVHSMLALDAHPFFLANSLLAVVAQRLVRVLNPETRVAYDISSSPETFAEIESLLEPGMGDYIYGPGGDGLAIGSDYQSRSGLFEIMSFNRHMRQLVADSCQSEELQRTAMENGMLDFRRVGLLKVAEGVTSIEEVMRVVPSTVLGVDD